MRRSIRFAALPAALLSALFLAASCSRQPSYAPAPVSGADVSIKVNSLPLDVPQFFTHKVRGKSLNFFVIRLNSGIQAYLDACATCFAGRRGFAHEDGAVVCRVCGTRYPVHKLDKGIGGCYPIRLQGRSENGRYIIPLASIEAEAGKF
jgi:hypothetical protein